MPQSRTEKLLFDDPKRPNKLPLFDWHRFRIFWQLAIKNLFFVLNDKLQQQQWEETTPTGYSDDDDINNNNIIKKTSNIANNNNNNRNR